MNLQSSSGHNNGHRTSEVLQKAYFTLCSLVN